MMEEPRYGARKERDDTWTIFDRRTGEIAERSGLIMARLNKNVVLGLVQILEQIEDAPKRNPLMSPPDTATLLEDAADRIADISRADLQIMLRRAALRLRNAGAVSMEDDVEEALRDLAGELGMTRNDTIRFIVREWMEMNTYFPVHTLDEDGEVDGTARSAAPPPLGLLIRCRYFATQSKTAARLTPKPGRHPHGTDGLEQSVPPSCRPLC